MGLLWLGLSISSGDATSKKRDLAMRLAQKAHAKHKSKKASKKAKKNQMANSHHGGHHSNKAKLKKTALWLIFLIVGVLVLCLCCLFGLGVFGYKKLFGKKSDNSQ